MSLHKTIDTLLLLAVSLATALAQDTRAVLLGVVADPAGASVPNARVSAINTDTGVRSATDTNGEGNYLIPYLLPGNYRLRVEREGFKSVDRGPIELRSTERTRVDVKLELGQVTDRITITAEEPLLEQADASRGQLIDHNQLTDLPVDGQNVYTMLQFAAGLNNTTGNWFYNREFDGAQSYSINGGQPGKNEFQLDGVSNTMAGGLAMSVPTSTEALRELKIQTNAYDAQYGRTSGGVISASVKAGTNRFHGAGFEYMRRTGLNANSFANNMAGKPRSEQQVDQYGFEIDGPVEIPRLYNGRNRTFFMFSYERFRDRLPLGQLTTVPSALERSGDFSKTVTAGGALYTVYDPLTVRPNPNFDPTKTVSLTNGRYVRTPFLGNRIPQNRMERIAVRALEAFPLPNQQGQTLSGANNYYGPNAGEHNTFYNLVNRFDHTINDRWKIFGRYSLDQRNGGRQSNAGWFGCGGSEDSRCHASSDTIISPGNASAVFDTVGTLTPTTILNFRFGYNYYVNQNTYVPYDQAAMGFPAALLSQLPTPDRFPAFTIENFTGTNNPENDIKRPARTYVVQGSLMKHAGKQTIKIGAEYRIMQWAKITSNSNGRYSFDRTWTRANPDINDTNSGNAIASMLMGYMASAQATINVAPFVSWRYPVVFFQDDVQLTRRLTINFGLRWDFERPPVERYDRQNRGFDFNAKSPIQVPGLDVRGGLLFAGVNGLPRTAFDPDYWNLQPRFGVAYKMFASRPVVFRGGFGRFFLPTNENGGLTGFTQSTNTVTATPDFQPFNVLSNPFPNGLIQPPGSGLGLAALAGDAITFGDPLRKMPYIWQYSAGFQFEFKPGNLIDLTYAGSQTEQIQITKQLNVLTKEQLDLGTAYLSASVPNPFYRVLPSNTTRGSGANTSRQNLLLPFPQFSNVSMSNTSLGGNWYNSLQVKFQQRRKHGLAYQVAYTFSKNMNTIQYRNSQDTALSRELTSYDVPHILSVTSTYEFPFGAKRKWLTSGVVSKIVGGWQYGWTGIFQSGTPMAQPDYYIMGDPKLTEGQSLDRWFNTSPSIWVQRPPNTLRTSSLYSSRIRRHTAPQLNMNVIRQFRIREGHSFQFKISAYNAANSAIFGAPTNNPTSPLFGVVNKTQVNLARSVDIGFRYSF